MTQLISVPTKKGYEVKLIDNLANYVKETYGEDQCNSHTTAFNEFNSMRSKMINKLLDKHESTIAVVTRYYDQFVALSQKIPINESGVKIEFTWEDAFGTVSLFGKKSSLKMASGEYERICVLFNIASIYSQVAEIQNLSDDSRLKTATKYLQQAAGIFSYLKSAAPSIIKGDSLNDLSIDTLNVLSVIMVAQAQELLFTKAARDQMKEANVAKIAQQTGDLYDEALKLMQLNSVKFIWPKEWLPLIGTKEGAYHALADYYQAKLCKSSSAYGEQISRLKKASELMKTASVRCGPKFMFQFEQERIRKDLDTAEKENNMIYHDAIPEIKCLLTIGKAVLARELPVEEPLDREGFRDLFRGIVSLAMKGVMTAIQGKGKAVAGAEVLRLREATDAITGVLNQYNLPGALRDSDGDGVPHELLERAAALRSSGGISKIDEMLNTLPDVMRRNEDLLSEALKMLDEEEESDKTLRAQFQERWVRTPSGKLTENWRGEAAKFTQMLQHARSSDGVIQKSYQENGPQIRILSQNEVVIKQSIPKSEVSQNQNTPAMKSELKSLCDSLESLKTARATLIHQIDNVTFDEIAARLTTTEENVANQEHLADDQLKKLFEPLREQVRQSLDAQEELLSRLRSVASQWMESDTGVRERAAAISGMLLALDKYNELTSHLQEGLKFYGDLIDIIIKFQNKVKDYCFARKTEKDELMKDLQSAITRERTETSGAAMPQTSRPSNQQAQAPIGQSQQPPAGQPYPFNPYNMPQPFMHGAPQHGYPQYGYQNQPTPYNNPQFGQAPQYPPAPGQGQQYPHGYNYPYQPR